MGRKRRIMMKRRKFGAKFSNHPVLRNRAAEPSVSEVVEEVVIEEEIIVEDDSISTSNAHISVTDDADLLMALLQELQAGLELPAAEEPAPPVKKTPARRKSTKRVKRTTTKKDK